MVNRRSPAFTILTLEHDIQRFQSRLYGTYKVTLVPFMDVFLVERRIRSASFSFGGLSTRAGEYSENP